MSNSVVRKHNRPLRARTTSPYRGIRTTLVARAFSSQSTVSHTPRARLDVRKGFALLHASRRKRNREREREKERTLQRTKERKKDRNKFSTNDRQAERKTERKTQRERECNVYICVSC